MNENTIEELKALQDDAMHEMSRELEHLDDMRAQVESRMKVMGATNIGKQADHRDSQDLASPEI